MRINRNQHGFSVIEVCVALLVVGVIAFAGYMIYDRRSETTDAKSNEATTSAKTTSAEATPSSVKIDSTKDLDTAATMLEQADSENSTTTDSAQLDAELGSF